MYKKDVNIANAVAIDGGLITPVLRNANLQDILSLSADVSMNTLTVIDHSFVSSLLSSVGRIFTIPCLSALTSV